MTITLREMLRRGALSLVDGTLGTEFRNQVKSHVDMAKEGLSIYAGPTDDQPEEGFRFQMYRWNGQRYALAIGQTANPKIKKFLTDSELGQSFEITLERLKADAKGRMIWRVQEISNPASKPKLNVGFTPSGDLPVSLDRQLPNRRAQQDGKLVVHLRS